MWKWNIAGTKWEGQRQAAFYSSLILMVGVAVLQNLDPASCSVLIPGNPKDLERPWRVWSGNPCQPCNIRVRVGEIVIGACRNPCFRAPYSKCKQSGDYTFTCECQTGFHGEFCEKPEQKRKDMLKAIINTEKTGVIAIGNDSDYLFQCNNTDSSKVHYELKYIQNYLKKKGELTEGGSLQFQCNEDDSTFDTPLADRCWKRGTGGECIFCKAASNSVPPHVFDQYPFGHFVQDVYNGTQCEDVIEIFPVFTDNSRKIEPIRDNVNCKERSIDEKTFRGGCRLNTTLPDTCIETIHNIHMGHRCKSCDPGVWGNKCQFVNEGDDDWDGCAEKEYRDNGPCGLGGQLVKRPNGKFCVCPPGKLDGFVSVFEDRVLDPDCSPAGKETMSNNWITDKESILYKFFVGMSQFHTYYGCRITDPCHTFDCQHNGTKEIFDLIDEDSYSFKHVSFTRSRLTALEINQSKLKCICNCQDGFEGVHCEKRNPCFFDRNYCLNMGICRRVDDVEKTCECVLPYSGKTCEIIDLCEAPEVCEGSTGRCFPCKHKGECKVIKANVSSSLSYGFTCNCTGILWVGENCQFSQGEVDVRLVTANPSNVLVGSGESYEIVVRRKGDKPHIIVDMGDGFHFSITEDSLVSVSGSGDTNEIFVYKFTHKFTKEGEYKIRAVITNGEDSISNEKIDQVNPIYLSGESSKTIVASLPDEIKCLPGARLINVGPTTDESTLYTRKNEFTVESVFEPKCEEIFEFDFLWNLHKLDSPPFPTPSPENNWHIEKIVNAYQKYVTFKPRVLVIGRYAIEYEVFVEVNGFRRSNSAKGYFNIELNPPKIVIQGGLERSVDVIKETIVDASESLDESFPERSHQLSFEWRCPLPCTLGELPEGPVLRIPAGSLTVGVTYDLHLHVSLEHDNVKRGTMASVRLIGSNGTLQIDCIENCDRMNPGDEILLQCTCVSCASPPAVEIAWEPSADGVTPIIKKDKPFTGILLPNVVSGDSRLRTVICRTTNPNLVAKLNVKVNTAPSGGACGIQPNKGVYLKTAFNITCEGFLDENVPLEYSFYANTDGNQGKDIDQKLYLLSHDTNPRAINVYLPYNPSGGDTVVSVKVTDRLGLSTIKQIKVAVELPKSTEYLDLLSNLVSGNDSLMLKRKKFGDDQGALQLQLVVFHGLLDNQFSGLHIEDIQDLRKSITSVLTKVPIHSFKAVEQTLHSLYLLKQFEDDESMESLKESSMIFFNGASRLAEFVLSDTQLIPNENIMVLARATTDSARTILKSAYDKGIDAIHNQPIQPRSERILTNFDSNDDIGRDYFLEVHELQDTFEIDGDRDVQENLNEIIEGYAKISHHAYTGIEHLLDAVGERLEDGHHFTVKTEDLTIYVKSEREISLAGLSLALQTGSGNEISVKLPGALKDTLMSEGISHTIIQVMEVLSNPFFDDMSAIPGTPVVSVVLKDRTPGGERLPVHLEKLDQPLELYMPLTSTAIDELSKTERLVVLKSLLEMSESELQPFHFILLYNTRVELTIEDFSIGMEFTVVVSKDFWPTKEDYCDLTKRKVLNQANGYFMQFDTEVLGLNEEPREDFLEYYVGIFPFRQGVFNQQEKYSVYFTRSSCLFRDENKKVWSEGGCIVGNDSTATSLHCICNHASVFAGTQFTLPNDIPTINVFDFNPEEFERNPVILITVITVLSGYFIGMLICWLLDRRDAKRHVGITIMADVGGDNESSYYLVSVLTGSRFQSGTTANVSIQFYGTKGRSQAYVIKEKSSPVLNRGGTDTFLVSSVKDLGELEKIRMWHDNSGNSPNWFCRKVIIKEAKSGKEWYFFIDRWLEITGTESTIIFEENAATEDDHSKFGRRYRENMTDQFDNSHLWLSMFRHPAASRFTRCQRLSCAFAIFTSYMLLTIIFYGIELEDLDDPLGLQKYVFAIQLTVMALPVGLVLVLTFRRIRQRYLPTLIIWRNRKKQPITGINTNASVFVPVKPKPKPNLHRKSQGKQMFGNRKNTGIIIGAGGGDFTFRDDVSEVSSNFSIPSTNVQDLEEWLGQQNNLQSYQPLGSGTHYTRRITEQHASDQDHIALGRMGLVHAVRAVDPNSFIFPGDGNISDVEDLIDDQIKSHLSENRVPSTKPKAIVLSSQKEPSVELDDTEEIGALLQNMIHKDKQQIVQSSRGILDDDSNSKEQAGLSFETCEMSPGKKAWGYLPWWFIFVAWILCLGIIVTCLYFTLIYGLHYGYLRSIDWLIGVASSFGLSMFVTQPLNVIISSLGLTLCLRSKKSSEIHEERFQILIKDEDDIGYRKPTSFKVFQPERKHPPLSAHDIFRLKVEARSREKIRNGLLKLMFYGFILVPLIVLAYDGHSSDNFLMVNNIRRLLHLTEPDFSRLTITNEIELFDYLENIFIPAVHPEVLYNGVRVRPLRFDPVFLDDGQTLLLGVPRIRQVRVRKDVCDTPTSIEEAFINSMNCFGSYSLSNQDKETYNPLWKPVINGVRSSVPTTNDVWKFNDFDPNFVRSLPWNGEMAVYDGGGYVAELGRRFRETVSVLRYLKRSRWIDHRTRAVFLEFTVLNPNVNIYADIVIVVERNPSQEFETSHHVSTLILSSSDDLELKPWIHFSYGMLIFSAVFLVILFFWNLFGSSGHQAYCKAWFWLDLMVIGGVLSSLLIALKAHIVMAESLEHIETMKINQFVSLQLVAFWSQISTATFSISQCICFMKIWRVLILIDERFLITSLTIKVTARFLLAYFLVLLIILIAFASAGHFIFGHDLAEFHTFSASMISLIDQILSVNFFSELATTHRILGPLYSFLFGFFVVFISLNLLISLLNQGLHEGKQIAAERSRRLTYGTYLSTVVNYIFAANVITTDQTVRTSNRSLRPDRLEAMKKTTANFFRESLLSSAAQVLREMKNHTNQALKGTGYRVISKLSRKHNEDIIKESRMDKMRLATGDYLRSKMGTEMSPEEFKDYADVNRFVVGCRVQRLERKLTEITSTMNRLTAK